MSTNTVWSKEVFAKNLRMYMDIAGKNQKEMAAIAGVSAPTFNDWLKAKKYPRIDKIERLANYFGILKSDLIEEKGEERISMHKKNDAITDIILRLRTDNDFLCIVKDLNDLDSDKLSGIKQLLVAFNK